ncbi:hypothetical protein BHE74_00001420 [Ensete ventricosum]|nr:hypothetical protein BHE74_00001420 [Ensete ventricosum]RZR78018.1 hypothetical protein BHM03_00003239 [Ensete ventricosum]
MGHPTLYDPMHLFDHHRGMRLDIDNMGYEVKSVCYFILYSSGIVHSAYLVPVSLNSVYEQQEAYEDRDHLGQLNCKHTFHSSCIMKWLSIKNVCPICKASALDDTPKGE